MIHFSILKSRFLYFLYSRRHCMSWRLHIDISVKNSCHRSSISSLQRWHINIFQHPFHYLVFLLVHINSDISHEGACEAFFVVFYLSLTKLYNTYHFNSCKSKYICLFTGCVWLALQIILKCLPFIESSTFKSIHEIPLYPTKVIINKKRTCDELSCKNSNSCKGIDNLPALARSDDREFFKEFSTCTAIKGTIMSVITHCNTTLVKIWEHKILIIF